MAENKTVRFGQKLRGAVLIMVVTVMFMLIILLLATLTVVSTAQNRAYLKYEENQAYYTARSALDVFTRNMLSDNAYYAYSDAAATKPREYYYTDPAKLSDAQLSVRQSGKMGPVKMKQGLALEFELYKIPAKNDAGFASNFKKSDGVFGSTAVALPEDENYSIDTTLTSDNGITYTVTFPAMGDGSDDYGRFVDTNSSGTQEATINVTIEERHFNFGGAKSSAFNSMTDAELKTCSSTGITKGGTTYTPQDLKDAIRCGNRNKDKMRVKITSRVTFMGVEGTAVLYYDTMEAPKVNSSQAITSLGGLSGGSGTIPVGGASTLDTTTTARENSVVVGNLFTGGDMTFPVPKHIYLYGDTVYTIKGNFSLTNSYPDVMKTGATLFISGTINMDQNKSFGTATNKVNVIADTVNFASNGLNSGSEFHGKMFSNAIIVGGAGDPVIDGKAYTNYINVDACVTRVDPPDATSFGSITIGAFSANGAKINVAKGYILTNSDGVLDTFTYTGGGARLVDSNGKEYILTTPFGNDTSKTVNVNYSDPSTYTLNAEKKKVFTLPDNIETANGSTKNTVEIPTTQAVYGEIFKEVAFKNDAVDTGANGDLNTLVMPQIDYSTLSSFGATLNDGTPISAAAAKMIADGTYNRYLNNTDPAQNEYVKNGIMTLDEYNKINAEYDDVTTSYWPVVTVEPGVASKVRTAVQSAQADSTFQAQLQAYYNNYVSGSEKAGETSHPDLLVYTSSVAPVTLENIDLTDTSIPSDTGATKIITSSGYILPNTQYGSGVKSGNKYSGTPVLIDARSGPITIQLGAENGLGTNQVSGTPTFKAYFVVIGDNPVKFYLPDGRDYKLGTSAGTEGFFVASYEIFKRIKSGVADADSVLALGNDSAATPSPNIFMYAGNGVKNIDVQSDSSFFSGNIYAPFSKYTYATNSGYTFKKVTYDGYEVDMGGAGFLATGSLICNGYESGNNVGVAYMSQDESKYTPGDTQFMWNAYQYARN